VLGASRPLDEYLLSETVGFFHVFIVMTFANLAEVSQLLDAELTSTFSEGLERVLTLPCQDDVADEPEKVVLSRRIGEILGDAKRLAGRFLQHTTNIFQHVSLALSFAGADFILKLSEHALVLTHPRNVARAEIAKPLILRLGFVVDHGAQKDLVLHHRVVDLTAKEIDSALHRSLARLVGDA